MTVMLSKAMRLRDYMTIHGLREDWVAWKLGLDRSSVNRIVRGVQKPSWETIAKIKRFTKGEVTADDFMKTVEGAGPGVTGD